MNTKEMSEFLTRVLAGCECVPKADVRVVKNIDVNEEKFGQCCLNKDNGAITIHITDGLCTSPFRLSACMSVLAHEAVHAALMDILDTLELAGVLNEDTSRRINERAAQAAESVVLNLIDNADAIAKEFKTIVKAKEDE